MENANNDFPFSKQLYRARLRLIIGKRTLSPKHVYQCPNCGRANSDTNCECGAATEPRYTLVGNKLYNSITNQELPLRLPAEEFPLTSLREFREKHNLSRKFIVEKFGNSYSNVADMEAGNVKTPQHIVEWMNMYEEKDDENNEQQ